MLRVAARQPLIARREPREQYTPKEIPAGTQLVRLVAAGSISSNFDYGSSLPNYKFQKRRKERHN